MGGTKCNWLAVAIQVRLAPPSLERHGAAPGALEGRRTHGGMEVDVFLWRNLKPSAVSRALAHLAKKKGAAAKPPPAAKPTAEKS